MLIISMFTENALVHNENLGKYTFQFGKWSLPTGFMPIAIQDPVLASQADPLRAIETIVI
ncbi:hypothetical protein DXJ84_11180 [Vibrio parahaemolyticus]|nr:hypothetical protein DXJ84_11180 [Vibrio parahaemolyticus]